MLDKNIIESVKNCVLSGLKIKYDFKSEINSWYSEISIYKYEDIFIIENPREQFNNIDDAVNYFIKMSFSSKNVGYIQNRLRAKGIIFGDREIENPTKEVKIAFKKESDIVDSEFNLLGIKINEQPKLEDALLEIENFKNLNINNISEELSKFENKYTNLDPYLSLSLVFDTELKYRRGINYKELNSDNFDYFKSDVEISGKKFHFLNAELSVKLRGTDFEYIKLGF